VALTEDLITGLKPCHEPAHGFDAPRQVRSWNSVHWFAQPGPHEAQDVRPARNGMPYVGMDGSRANSHQNLVSPNLRGIDFLKT
jgi:hypothetical protein